MSTPPALTNTDIERLSALRDEVQAGGRSEGEVVDRRERAWLGFWRWLNDPAMCAVRNRSEWSGDLVDVTFSVRESRGVTYTSVTLRDCLTVAGLTREQALRNLDDAARRYAGELERKPHGPHGKHQLAILHRYLMQRKETCPCEIDPCQCAADERIAH